MGSTRQTVFGGDQLWMMGGQGKGQAFCKAPYFLLRRAALDGHVYV